MDLNTFEVVSVSHVLEINSSICIMHENESLIWRRHGNEKQTRSNVCGSVFRPHLSSIVVFRLRTVFVGALIIRRLQLLRFRVWNWRFCELNIQLSRLKQQFSDCLKNWPDAGVLSLFSSSVVLDTFTSSPLSSSLLAGSASSLFLREVPSSISCLVLWAREHNLRQETTTSKQRWHWPRPPACLQPITWSHPFKIKYTWCESQNNGNLRWIIENISLFFKSTI